MKAITIDYFIEECDTAQKGKVVNVYHEDSLKKAMEKMNDMKVRAIRSLRDPGEQVPFLYNIDMRVTATECGIVTEAIHIESTPELPF